MSIISGPSGMPRETRSSPDAPSGVASSEDSRSALRHLSAPGHVSGRIFLQLFPGHAGRPSPHDNCLADVCRVFSGSVKAGALRKMKAQMHRPLPREEESHVLPAGGACWKGISAYSPLQAATRSFSGRFEGSRLCLLGLLLFAIIFLLFC